MQRLARLWAKRSWARRQDPLFLLEPEEFRALPLDDVFTIVHPPTTRRSIGVVTHYALASLVPALLSRWEEHGIAQDPLTRRSLDAVEIWRLCRAARAQHPRLLALFLEHWLLERHEDDGLWPDWLEYRDAQHACVRRRHALTLPLYQAAGTLPPFIRDPLRQWGPTSQLHVLLRIIYLDEAWLLDAILHAFPALKYGEQEIGASFWRTMYLGNLADVACNFESFHSLRVCLQHGVEPRYGVHTACVLANIPILRLLLARVRDTNSLFYTLAPCAYQTATTTWEGRWLARQCAVIGGASVLRVLSAHGCPPPPVRAEHSESLLHIALGHSDDQEMMTLLLLNSGLVLDDAAQLGLLGVRDVARLHRTLALLVRILPPQRWAPALQSRVWQELCVTYLSDESPVPITTFLDVVSMVRRLFPTTPKPGGFGQTEESWLVEIFSRGTAMKARIPFLLHWLHACAVLPKRDKLHFLPHLDVRQWSAVLPHWLEGGEACDDPTVWETVWADVFRRMPQDPTLTWRHEALAHALRGRARGILGSPSATRLPKAREEEAELALLCGTIAELTFHTACDVGLSPLTILPHPPRPASTCYRLACHVIRSIVKRDFPHLRVNKEGHSA